MKGYNSNIGKAQLRCEQFNRSQNKSQFKGKKSSLNKRIIGERAKGITAKNIEDECDRLGCMIETDELTAAIMYYLKFGRDARPSLFNDDMILGILDRIKDLQVKFLSGIITAREQLEILEDMEAQIIERLDNYKQLK